jgi:thiol-activated cytolysin
MKRILYLFPIVLFFVSCNKNEEVALTFEDVIAQGGGFEPVTTSEQPVDEETSVEIINGEVWNCTTITYDAMAPGGGDNGFPLFNPNASVIYPGSLLQGNSLRNATPDVIAVERAGGTISYDLVNGNISSYFSVERVTKSSIQNAMNQIIANSPPDLPANFVFNYSQVQSERALALKLGIDYETAFTSISGNFGFSSGSNLNRIVVELNQSFYTMSFDIPTSLDGLFAPSVTPADLAKYVYEGNPATYISDVTYGRIYYMLIESTSSYTEMEAAVSASFSGVVATANADISGHSLNTLSNLKIKVMAFGGEATTTMLTIGETNLNNLVTLLAESTTIATGVPISYVVRSVYDNRIVSVQLATQYDVTTCEPAQPGGEPPYTAHWKGNVLSRMGPVGAAFSGEGTEFYLINKAGDQYMVSNVGSLEGPFPISNLGTGTPPFNIGSACRIEGNQVESSWVMVIDVTGSQYSYLRGDGSWSTQITPISNLAEGNNPFSINGIGAMFFRHRDPNGPLQRWIFNKDGTHYALYRNNPNSFGDVNEVAGSGWQLPFSPEKVGAGIGFFLGVNRFFIVFDHTGTKYAVHGPIYGAGQVSIGPFDL